MISIYEAYVGLGHLFAYDHACLNRADVYVFRLLWVTEIFSDRDETCPNAYHHDACKVCVYMLISVRSWNFKDGGSLKASFLAKNQRGTKEKSLKKSYE